jgi:NAD(P)-dependent dehydrogenase (short-subunit alcohol dehydrogenase family)
MGRLDGKVAAITGGASGIGEATVRRFVAEGASVAFCDRDGERGQRIAAELEGSGAKVVFTQADVGTEAACLAFVNGAAEKFGRLDILVNNAGIAPGNLAENVTEEDFDQTLAINLKGTFFACQAAARYMIPQKSGWIINMGSQAGFAALPTEAIYCMTKAGISHLTKCLAVEWGKYNILVNAVAPTFIHTPGTEEYLADPAAHQDTVERIAALHRIGEPIEVAGAVVFLASPAASLITGHTLVIDGGWTAR